MLVKWKEILSLPREDGPSSSEEARRRQATTTNGSLLGFQDSEVSSGQRRGDYCQEILHLSEFKVPCKIIELFRQH